jgi:hypothetical protein
VKTSEIKTGGWLFIKSYRKEHRFEAHIQINGFINYMPFFSLSWIVKSLFIQQGVESKQTHRGKAGRDQPCFPLGKEIADLRFVHAFI